MQVVMPYNNSNLIPINNTLAIKQDPNIEPFKSEIH